MNRTLATLLSLMFLLLAAPLNPAAAQQEAKAALALPAMAEIQGGLVQLLFPIQDEEATPVDTFYIDLFPVTNADYLEFVLAHPEWRRSVAPEVFADAGYLKGWLGDHDLGALQARAPVTHVSWFAAAAYCEARGARLPTEAEWEMAAKAGLNGPDGATEPGHNERLLTLTANRAATPGPVGAGAPNYYGVYDMHGLVWEWVFDIGSSMATGDSRSEGDRRLQLVCGGGSAGATDKSDYAAFLRYAYRSGLDGNYSGSGLGFRCAN